MRTSIRLALAGCVLLASGAATGADLRIGMILPVTGPFAA